MIERKRLSSFLAYVSLLVGLAFALGPLYFAVCSASVTNAQLLTRGLAGLPSDQFVANVAQASQRIDLFRLMGNSLLVATLVTLGKLALSALTAFAVVYFRIRYTPIIFFIVLGSLLLPFEVRIIPTYAVASNLLGPLHTFVQAIGITSVSVPNISVLDSYSGLALPLIACATGTFLFRQFFTTLPPELAEAARLDGAGPWRFFVDILLPLSKTNFSALGTIVFIGAWKEYLWPLVATNREEIRTLVLGVARFMPTDTAQTPEWNLLLAATVISLLPPILIVALMQRLFIKGIIGVEK